MNPDDIFKQIEEMKRQQIEIAEKELAEIIQNYDFIVGSDELKVTLGRILPEGAKIIYSRYIDDPTKCYMVKKFDVMDLPFAKLEPMNQNMIDIYDREHEAYLKGVEEGIRRQIK